MSFNFIDDSEDTDDEEFLDLSDLSTTEESGEEEGLVDDEGVWDFADTPPEDSEENLGFVFEEADEDDSEVEEVTAGGFSFAVEDEIPQARKITDPEVKERARRGRKRSPAKMDYAGKTALGWSLFCAHKDHLPNLCEREQNDGKVTCTCPCHEARGYVRSQPEPVSGSDDEEFVLLLD